MKCNPFVFGDLTFFPFHCIDTEITAHRNTVYVIISFKRHSEAAGVRQDTQQAYVGFSFSPDLSAPTSHFFV